MLRRSAKPGRLTWRGDDQVSGLPDFSAAGMAGEFEKLLGFQQQLAALDPTGWPVPQQVDYQLVRAEMNGVEFRHRVLKPWAIDPGFYNDVINRLGIAAKKGQIELELPLSTPPRAQPHVLHRASPCCAASDSLPP